jgi:four helix bundle protein
VEIALGSSYELETQILIAEAVNFGEHSLRDNLLYNIMEEQRMLVTFISRLNK